VIKVAPPGLEPVRNRDVLRQARAVKAAMTIPGVRVPTILFEDGGDPPETPPLFAMTFEPGECMEPIFDRSPLPEPEAVRGRALAAARMMGALHRADPAAAGLDEAPVSLKAEVDRWVRAFSTVDLAMKGRADEAAGLLFEQLPAEQAGVLLHGDYRLGNMLCRGGEVTALIDWEIWSISDRRLDLAWFLLHRDYRQNPHAAREAPGMPAAEELIGEYESAAGFSVVDLSWFEALVRFKQAAAGALIWKRNPPALDDPQSQKGPEKLRRQVADAIAILVDPGS
jgi:aminoglycoside phosphotransferase (APT) family kinase protein